MNAGIFKRSLIALALAAVALLAAPTLAHAESDTYPPNDSFISVQPPTTVAQGGVVTLSFIAGSFGPGQSVSFTLNGESATAATLASFHTAVDTLGTNKSAGGDGSLSTSITLPGSAVGSYNLTAATAGWTRTWVFSVASPGDSGAETGSNLALGGSDSNEFLWVWIGGGALSLAGGGVLIWRSARKQRKLVK